MALVISPLKRLTNNRLLETFVSVRIRIDHHLLVVGDGRWGSVVPSYWNNVVDNNPRVVPSCEDPIYILRADVRDVVE